MRIKVFAFIAIATTWAACQPFVQGERLYIAHCATCHMEDGTGLAGLIPPLAGADYLELNRHLVPCIIAHGTSGGVVVNGVTYEEPMQAFPELTDVELSNIINYINTSWGNDLPLTSPSEVNSHLQNCPG